VTEELPSTLQPLGVHAVAGHIDRLVEGVRGGEVVREQNVEYSPQLVEVVLERRAGEEQSVVAREARERTMQPARLILEVMRFVHHEDRPPWTGL
jgi:hypothetical protein